MLWSRHNKNEVSREPWSHIVIIDGTLSQLTPGKRTHCGRLYSLLSEDHRPKQKVYYDEGVQGSGWLKWLDVASGRGLNKSIIRSYLKLSENYRKGDKIYLFGFSRGAYAVRLLAAMLDEFGLLKPQFSTKALANRTFTTFAKSHRNVHELGELKSKCINKTPVEYVGVWDTVKALGLPYPILRRFSPMVAEFKDYKVPSNVKRARHALAKNEIRAALEPIFFKSKSPGTELKQMIFPGSHAIIGGQIFHLPEANKLSNLSMIWILESAVEAGMIIPLNWKRRYPQSHKYIEDEIDERWFWRKSERVFKPDELFLKHPSLEEKRTK